MSGGKPLRVTSGRYHFLGVVLVTLLVMILGILVVAMPERMGVPQATATPAASPTVTLAP